MKRQAQEQAVQLLVAITTGTLLLTPYLLILQTKDATFSRHEMGNLVSDTVT